MGRRTRICSSFPATIKKYARAGMKFLFRIRFLKILWRIVGKTLHFSSAYHAPTDGHCEVVNRSLGNLLRSLVGEHPRLWDTVLPQAEQ